MALYVYSIVGADHPRDLDGLSGVGSSPEALRSVAGGQLHAIVSEISEEIRPKQRDLARHHEVQERMMDEGTVLPLQFGYVAPDESTVRQVLEENADRYLAALDRLAGCSEYHLKASQEEDVLLRRVLQEVPEAWDLDQRIRAGSSDPGLPLALGELLAREVGARQDELADTVVRELAVFAQDQNVHPPAGEDFLNLSLLVPREEEENFLKRQDALSQQHLDGGVRFRLSGPLPPYSFVR
ncbi:gas vesicle protein [Streptomyces sp. ms191]|uniref:GvpL/GvpF family gas vesicle protein n=1 Tax=unclassified Streptomyces TaxID=2593676 RepID=UPI0011CDAA81|nr:GvpL/GvpF family gas vesicle protein [Streptomyces sp. ms191]TXS32861.1 gas vesicle protein [Streptomyces sp. ms191]